jgi:PAS domain S-box-containing protein
MSRSADVELVYPSIDDVVSGIFKLSSEGFIITDAQCRILMVNPGAEAMFGARRGELLGESVERLIPERHHAAHKGHVARFAGSGSESAVMGGRQAVVARRMNGDEFAVEASISKLDSPAGRFFTVILRDATERREARRGMVEALRSAEAATAAKSAFLATMSHEIRTPLNAILGMAQALDREDLSAGQRERLDVIRQSGEVLLTILNDVLDLSKIEAGKIELKETSFDLESVVAGAQAAFSAIAESKGLAFDLELRGADGCFRGDPTRIRQILYNLISNALKFTNAGEVRVIASFAAGRLRMVVADTGVGIEQEALATLFEPFVQADNATRAHGGTGLGLTICRQLAELMGGAISVESRVGAGSTFSVDVALEQIEQRGERPVEVRGGAHAIDVLPRLRVLAAEDNASNRLVLEAVLQQVGIRPSFAGDGVEAVEAWESGEYDVILMDVQMPNLSGPDATRMIRQREASLGRAPTVVVALTANAMSHQHETYLAAGMDRILTKPLEIPKLLTLMHEIAQAKLH